jgi:hypothetical protein
MGAVARRQYWDDVGLVKLLTGVFAGPVVWAFNLEINYSLVPWACASGRTSVLAAVSVVALILVVGGGILSWRCWRSLKDGAGNGAGVRDRSAFLAVSGLALCALFAMLIATSATLHAFVSPCP